MPPVTQQFALYSHDIELGTFQQDPSTQKYPRRFGLLPTNAFKIYIQKILDAGIYIVRIAGNYIELRFAQVIKKPLGFMPVS